MVRAEHRGRASVTQVWGAEERDAQLSSGGEDATALIGGGKWSASDLKEAVEPKHLVTKPE